MERDMDIVSVREFEENMNAVCAQSFGDRMNNAYAREFEADFIVNNRLNKQYSIVYQGSNFDGTGENCLIPVKSRREIELLLLSLGEQASVRMDEQERKQCNIWDWLYGRTYTDIFNDLKWSYREEDEVLDIIEKIPLPKTLRNSSLKINSNDPEPERIDPVYVHKTNRENVLISEPYQYGNMFYFNGFNKSAEFNIDHSSDHLEGIIIFEAARQAGIASVHLAGVPLNGAIVILKTVTRYTRFVECSKPYLIRTIPAIKLRGGCSFGVYNVIQDGHSCTTGYFTGIVYKNKESYQKFRNIKLSEKTSGGNEASM
jgi:hypothetical protein